MMCKKFPLGNLNPNPYPPHCTPHYTITYICEVTTASRVHDGDKY